MAMKRQSSYKDYFKQAGQASYSVFNKLGSNAEQVSNKGFIQQTSSGLSCANCGHPMAIGMTAQGKVAYCFNCHRRVLYNKNGQKIILYSGGIGKKPKDFIRIQSNKKHHKKSDKKKFYIVYK